MPRRVFHLIANAHLDPVWLWDWRDGMTEGIITCRTMLDLMDEFPDFTFVRGEAAIYRHIEQHDPPTFARIARRVAEGRWDVVGGTWIQPDTNLPATETFVRHYHTGQRYFAERFGRPVRVAWAADSFGHAAGLPDVMAGAGIEGFAFTRPEENILPMPLPAFWWQGCGGNRILAYRPMAGWYGSERHEVAPKLDKLLALADKQPLVNVGFFYGLGDHGGGASRRHLEEIRAWAAQHPEVEVVHSGLHRLHDAITAEVRGGLELPVHNGEMNFTLRGCYASVAKFKWPYRRAEAQLANAEALDALTSAAIGRQPADLGAAWEAVLFNSFHDILPGSSIERAYDDAAAWLGSATHRCLEVECTAMTALAARIDSRVPATIGDHPAAVPLLVWNPHPFPVSGHVELEVNLDYRPIFAYQHRASELPVEVRDHDGTVLPHQLVECEHHAMPDVPWRKRAVVPVELPPLGWRLMSLGWVEGAVPPTAPGIPASSPEALTIANARYRVSATLGGRGVRITCDGKPVMGGDGLGAAVFADTAGSWGGADGPADIDLHTPLETWTVVKVEVREHGPERAALWVRLAGARSRLDLAITLLRGRDAVDLHARLMWDERAARLRLLMPGVDSATYEVPGGAVTRGAVGDVPALGWAVTSGPGGGFGLASDALSSYTVAQGLFSATVVRTSHYAFSNNARYPADSWWAVADCGELRFRFAICPPGTAMPAFARTIASPPLIQVVPATAAVGSPMPRTASLASITPASLTLQALKPAADGDGLVLRVLETSGAPATATLNLLGLRLDLGQVAAGAIASWRLRRTPGGWDAIRCSLLES
jgi:alpha-mannosidase